LGDAHTLIYLLRGDCTISHTLFETTNRSPEEQELL